MKALRRPQVGIEDLSKKLKSRLISCFLCGPGVGTAGYQAREEILKYLKAEARVEVVLGEDLPKRKIPLPRPSPQDLQTLESDFAKTVDLTLLLLESPGAIAELGSFCMIPQIRAHLYVLVPEQFHGSESYIARGPLDLLARMHSLSVVYYSSAHDGTLRRRIAYPIMLHKYARLYHAKEYDLALRGGPQGTVKLQSVMAKVRGQFLPRLVAATIAILDRPNYSELAATLRVGAGELRAALKTLFDGGLVLKRQGKYELSVGLDSSVFDPFNRGALSKKKCLFVAAS